MRDECQVKNGLVVNGANVTIVSESYWNRRGSFLLLSSSHDPRDCINQFALAVEHTTEDQVIWSGEDGKLHVWFDIVLC